VGNPRIEQCDDQIGFHWVTSDGQPTTLPALIRSDDEPERLPPTHLSALDDALIVLAERFGDMLGGGRAPEPGDEAPALRELHRALDRLVHEYAASAAQLGITPDIRAGQIIGTAALFGIRARLALGTACPAPFAGELDEPCDGVVAGRGQLLMVEEGVPWRGGRWVLATEDGRAFPLTLSMVLFDSSGTNMEAALQEHRAALAALTEAAAHADAETFVTEGALDWLLGDWLMAHRESPDSAAIEIPKQREAEAAMIVAAADSSALLRARFDFELFAV
jgi:hypothetical protein